MLCCSRVLSINHCLRAHLFWTFEHIYASCMGTPIYVYMCLPVWVKKSIFFRGQFCIPCTPYC